MHNQEVKLSVTGSSSFDFLKSHARHFYRSKIGGPAHPFQAIPNIFSQNAIR
ncbi:hypothetical protein [Mucilaginibacter gotjawali]|uniref:Uncharacterized protein n=1 Tax=Mucilaginibacter gotjawali TaxID=1550579 RepID=A0A839SG66_9SPHI|nr:hypothetical protein [Mucilaginibacter gotjawali]MBB3057285.1 hypothetical protein [Mucilaginibacter gotjawali]